MKTVAILCNGIRPRKSILNQFEKKYDFDLICADGGANSARKLGFLPKTIIGDLDSIKEGVLVYFKRRSVTIKKLTGQNDTDLEKALKFVIENKYNQVLIFGFSGKRFDHTLSNISNSMKYSKKLEVLLIDNYSVLQFVRGKKQFASVRGETISLICFDQKTKIKTSNLLFPLNSESLQFGRRESTSNVAANDNFILEVKNGVCLMTRALKNFLQVSNRS